MELRYFPSFVFNCDTKLLLGRLKLIVILVPSFSVLSSLDNFFSINVSNPDSPDCSSCNLSKSSCILINGIMKASSSTTVSSSSSNASV